MHRCLTQFTTLQSSSTRVRLVVRKQPSRYGFSVLRSTAAGERKSKIKSHVIDAGVKYEISVAWTPPKVGTYRHIFIFQALLQTHTSHGTPKFAKNGILCTVTVEGKCTEVKEHMTANTPQVDSPIWMAVRSTAIPIMSACVMITWLMSSRERTTKPACSTAAP